MSHAKYYIMVIVLALPGGMVFGKTEGSVCQKPSQAKIIDELLAKMTLEEKIGQLSVPCHGGGWSARMDKETGDNFEGEKKSLVSGSKGPQCLRKQDVRNLTGGPVYPG